MTGEHESGSSRLDEILAEYLQRVEAGEPVDREVLLRQHPEFADELREFLADDSQWKRVAKTADSEVLPTIDVSSHDASDVEIAPTFDSAAPVHTAEVAAQRVGYFGDYELLEEIARGGMGVVYKARQVNLNRVVALKMILSGQLASEADVRRFYQEAEAAANLEHSGIVPIFEVGEHDGQHFFSMGYIDGPSLAQLLADGPLPPREAAQVVRQVAEAIAYAHARGVIHRDLKPANILLKDSRESRDKSPEPETADAESSRLSTIVSRPCVTDFGLAKRTEGESELTGTGQILGTPSYMPPEQASGRAKEIGPAADVYSLGAILYCALTGHPPFQAANPMDTLMQVLKNEPPAPRQLNPQTPRDLETICLKCLQKEPNKRYVSAQELADELGRWLDGVPIQARPVGTLERGWRWCGRNPVVAGLSAAVVLLLLAGILTASVLAMIAERKAVEAAENARREGQQRERAVELAATNLELANQEKAARRQADQRYRQATAMRLAAQANEAGRERPVEGLLVAMEAVKTCYSRQEPVPRMARQALLDLLARVGGRVLPGSDERGGVRSFLRSPDDKLLATAGDAGTVRIWDLTAPAPFAQPRILAGHRGSVKLAFRNDSEKLAVATGGGQIHLWNLAADNVEKPEVILRGHGAFVDSVAFSPDGTRLVSSGITGHGRGFDHRVVMVWPLENSDPAEAAIRFETRGQIQSVFFAPDNRRVVTVEEETTFKPVIRLWTVEGSKPQSVTLSRDLGQQSKTRIKVSPDSRYIAASGFLDKTVQVWDLAAEDPAESRLLQGHAERVAAFEFRPGTSHIVTAGGPVARIWDLQAEDSAAEPRLFEGHSRSIAFVAFDHRARRLATASHDRTVRVWDLAAKDPAASAKLLTGHDGVVQFAAFHRDERGLITFGTDQTARFWDLWSLPPSAGAVVLKGHTAPIDWAGFTAQAPVAATFDEDGELRIWHLTYSILKSSTSLRGHTDGIKKAIFTPDGRYLVSLSHDQTARVWDLTHSDGSAARLTVRGQLAAALGPGGKRLVMAREVGIAEDAAKMATALIWDLAERNTVSPAWELRGHEEEVRAIALSPDGRLVATGDRNSEIRIWDLRDPSASQRVLSRPPGPRIRTWEIHVGGNIGIYLLVFSPDGKQLLAGDAAGGLWLWNLDSANPADSAINLETGSNAILHAVFSPDGKTVAASRSREIRLYDLTVQDPAGSAITLKGHGQTVQALCFHPNAHRLATFGEDARTHFWDLTAEISEPALTLRGHEAELSSFGRAPMVVRYDPDGRRLLTAGVDRTARIWDLTSSPPSSIVLDGHDRLVSTAAISWQADKVLTGSWDGTARVWDLTSPSRSLSALILRGHSGGVQHVTLANDGRTAITLDKDDVLRVWDLEVAEQLSTAQSRAGRDLTKEERLAHLIPAEP